MVMDKIESSRVDLRNEKNEQDSCMQCAEETCPCFDNKRGTSRKMESNGTARQRGVVVEEKEK
jgi:hypothetical protein